MGRGTNTADLSRLPISRFFQQEFMDVDDAATWENFLKAILLQLVVTRTTAHHHGFDVQIIQSIGHAVEQHAVVGGDFLCFSTLPAPFCG